MKEVNTDAHRGGRGGGVRSEKLSIKTEIKQKEEDPLDFLTAPSTPSKEFGQNPKDPPPEFQTTVHLWRLKRHSTDKKVRLIDGIYDFD